MTHPIFKLTPNSAYHKKMLSRWMPVFILNFCLLLNPGAVFGVNSGGMPFMDAQNRTDQRLPARIHPLDDRRASLLDPDQRIPPKFHIPKGLTKRTQFWFDVYTRYDSDQHVVHHKKYPWIVFHVIDTKQFARAGGTMWTTYNRSKKYVRRKVTNVKAALLKLSKMKHYKKLSSLERQLFRSMAKVKGPRSQVFKLARNSVRSQLGQRDFFVEALRKSTKYLAYMEEVFLAQGLPVELTRIPFVESSFNTRAYSKVGASGIWQIMPRTGERYIKVSKYIDERNSPIKATRAAAKIFKNYHRRLKAWPITITGYNHGVGGMSRAVRKTKSRDLSKIIKSYHRKSFGFASSNFYASFLAALHAEKYSPEIFSSDNIKKKKLQLFNSVRLGLRIRPTKLAYLVGIPVKRFQAYNLDLRRSISRNLHLPKGLEVHFPPEANLNVLKSAKLKKKLITQYKSSQKSSN